MADGARGIPPVDSGTGWYHTGDRETLINNLPASQFQEDLMTKPRLLQAVASMAVVVLFVCGQSALAQHHFQIRTVPGMQSGARAQSVQGFDELFQLASGFGALPPEDGGGNVEWPCFPNLNDNGADCATIANGGVVVGMPAHTWSYAACDANTATSPDCGQIFWFYEDDTGDNTDPLIISIVVRQGTTVLLDTGNVTLAQHNPTTAGSVVAISDDVAFGTLGQTGKGNGFCAGTRTTCVNPQEGLASVMVTTKVGASKITSKFSINLQ
jgi:hypothetical protein